MFSDEIKLIIHAAGAAVPGVNFFGSSVSKVPIGDGPFLFFRESGGIPPDKTHNSVAIPAYVRPSGQFRAVGKDVVATRLILQKAYLAVSAVINQLIGAATYSVSLTRIGNLVTAVTEEPHGWSSGYSITIAGATQSGYNGTVVITVVDDTTFTYVVGTTPASPSSGLSTASYAGTWYRRIDPLQEPFDLGVDSSERVQFVFNFRADKTFS